MRFHALALLYGTAAASQGPCDITGAAGNPCVAAHSTTRALFAAYGGPLYNVTRASDGQSFSVPLLAPGGFADKGAHDNFCPKLDCVISNVYDQSGNGNHLGQRHKLVNASQHVVTVGDGLLVLVALDAVVVLDAAKEVLRVGWRAREQARRNRRRRIGSLEHLYGRSDGAVVSTCMQGEAHIRFSGRSSTRSASGERN